MDNNCVDTLEYLLKMNTELQLFSIVRKRKLDYEYGAPHKVFENMLHQDFKAESINQKWCTDFTYLFFAHCKMKLQ